jgi:lysozyme
MAIPVIPGVPNPALVIDVSQFQANADLTAARAAGVRAVFLKATEGATFQDGVFRTLYDKALAAGLKIGVYHFGTARPPSEQVENFIATVTRIAGGFANIIPVLDLEHNDPSPDNTISPDQGEAWVLEFRGRTNRGPLLYAGGFLRDRGGATGRVNLQSCPLWLADYETSPHPIPGCPAWSLWQFTDGSLGPYAGKVPGVGRCDQNVFNGDAVALDAFWATQAPP